jgi:hypothetical protein
VFIDNRKTIARAHFPDDKHEHVDSRAKNGSRGPACTLRR